MAASSYIFFEPDLCERFVQVLAQQGLGCRQQADAIEGQVVELLAEPDEAVLEMLEAEYEALMQAQMLRAEQHAGWGSHQVVSLQIERADGRSAEVRLPPAVARPLLAHFSVEEARALVQAIAHSLEHPAAGPLCRKDLLGPPPG